MSNVNVEEEIEVLQRHNQLVKCEGSKIETAKVTFDKITGVPKVRLMLNKDGQKWSTDIL